ncbi:MAG: ABC transporter permease [Muribaculaceae bacterium]|nr:ABC transporter permease [Muribaculaceae bacterium]
MNYPLFLAKRLSLTSGKGKSSPAVTVAIISIALSVIIMIASIAIVLGFKREIREKVVGFNGHISLYRIPISEFDDNILSLDSDLQEKLDSFNFITDYSVQTAVPAILKTPSDFKGVYMKALSGAQSKQFMEKNMEEGEIPDFTNPENTNKIVISRIAANQLKLEVGDKIDTYFISDDVRVRKLDVAAIYNSHFDQYDDILIYGSMPLINKMGDLEEGSGTFILIYTDDFDKIEEYASFLQYRMNEDALSGKSDRYYRTDNVLNQGRGFFSWLSLLDTNVVVIIILMLTIGAVTLISGMLIIILERKKFIGLVRALGASSAKIRSVFIYMALKIAMIGLLVGNSLIILLLIFQDKYHFIKLDADSYYIDYVPVEISFWMVIAINAGVLLVAYLVLVLPSRFVGKISPAETMVKS